VLKSVKDKDPFESMVRKDSRQSTNDMPQQDFPVRSLLEMISAETEKLISEAFNLATAALSQYLRPITFLVSDFAIPKILEYFENCSSLMLVSLALSRL
jgi:hypothetical protein